MVTTEQASIQHGQPRALRLRYVDRCSNCGCGAFRTWSASVRARSLHVTQSQCRACGLVFSNPQCDESMLNEYYAHTYYEAEWPDLLRADSPPVTSAAERIYQEVQRIMRYVQGGRILDIGAGTGLFLSAARDAGFEPFGVEPSAAAAEHARRVHGLANVVPGAFGDARFEPASFDVVYAWHVIEHVLDVDSFVTGVRRLLRPGGYFWVGTENYSNASYWTERAACLVRGLPPPFATSDEHTYAFTARTLSDVLRRRGFAICRNETYQPPWREKRRTMRFGTPLGHGYFLGLHALNQMFGTGPLIRAIATVGHAG